MKTVGKVLKILVYIMGAQIVICAILDILHITDFTLSKWSIFEGLVFTIILILACIFSEKND